MSRYPSGLTRPGFPQDIRDSKVNRSVGTVMVAGAKKGGGGGGPRHFEEIFEWRGQPEGTINRRGGSGKE